MIKVAHLLWSGGFGGAERHVFDLVNGLSKDKFRSIVFFLNDARDYGDLLVKTGFKVFEIGMCDGYDLKGIIRFAKNLSIEKPSIIHDHVSTPWIRILVKVLFPDVNTVYTSHNSIYLKHFSPTQKFYARLSAKYTDQMIAVSRILREKIIKELSFPPNKIHYIPNFVRTDRFETSFSDDIHERKRRLSLPDDALVLTFIGRLSLDKGADRLIPIIAPIINRKPRLFLLIVGEGDLFPTILSQVGKYNIQDQVLLLSSRKDIPELLSLSDLLIMPSRIETFGIVAIEAMMSGIPVVAASTDGLKEIIDNNVSGILVEQNRFDLDFSSSVEKLLKDPVLRKEMGKRGKQKVVSQYSQEIIIPKIEELYLNLSQAHAK